MLGLITCNVLKVLVVGITVARSCEVSLRQRSQCASVELVLKMLELCACQARQGLGSKAFTYREGKVEDNKVNVSVLPHL